MQGTRYEPHENMGKPGNRTEVKPDGIYAEMQEALFELKRDLDTYQKKIDNALVLLSIMEGRQAKRENYQQYEQQLNEIQHLISQSMDTVNQHRQWSVDSTDNVMETEYAAQVHAGGRYASPQKPVISERQQLPMSEAPVKKKKKSHIGDILFYGILALFLVGVLVVQVTSGGGVKTFMGFSMFTVRTSSMEDVYPKGSLIVTKSVDAKDLRVGDDITYLASETSTITHRIISIYDNYENTNERGFETQGIMNKDPDEDIVPAVNVVGKVIFCSMFLGQAWAFVSSNWPILVFGLVVIIALSLVLRYIFKQPDDKKMHEERVYAGH